MLPPEWDTVAPCPVPGVCWGQAAPVPCPLSPTAVGAGLQQLHTTHTAWSRSPAQIVPGTQTSPQHLHAPRDRNDHLKTLLFQSRKLSLKTFYVSVYNRCHVSEKLSHCYNKILRSKKHF